MGKHSFVKCKCNCKLCSLRTQLQLDEPNNKLFCVRQGFNWVQVDIVRIRVQETWGPKHLLFGSYFHTPNFTSQVWRLVSQIGGLISWIWVVVIWWASDVISIFLCFGYGPMCELQTFGVSLVLDSIINPPSFLNMSSFFVVANCLISSSYIY